jgi:lysophospholipase L1-like esterase
LGNGDGINEGEYYFAYGDSITQAIFGGGLSPDGSDCYVMQMRNLYDPGKTVDHNLDGSGQDSTWGLANFNAHYNVSNVFFIFLFGANDAAHGMTNALSASNMVALYNTTKAHGSTPELCLMTLMNPDVFSYAIQKPRITATEQLCKNFSIPFVKMYDAIDSVPWNGRLDDWNGFYYGGDSSGVHPNITGHRKMADFLWYFISGSDHQETYFSSNDTIISHVYYNETLYIPKQSAWIWSHILVLCLTNMSLIIWTRGYGNTIQFNGVKGSSYQIWGDQDAPTVTIIKPQKALYINDKMMLPFPTTVIIKSITIEVNATDNSSGVDHVEFYIDNFLKANLTSEMYAWKWDRRTPLKFNHQIKIVAYDKAGHSTEATMTVWKFL